MNCPSCGLLNSPAAQTCVHCKASLGSPYIVAGAGRNVIDLSRAKSAAAAVRSPSQAVPTPSDWREQLTLQIERLKEKNNESPPSESAAPPGDFRNREFVKPGRPANLSDTPQAAPSARPDYHPLAEKALEKIDRARGSAGAPASAVPLPETPADAPLEAPLKRKRPQRRSETVERIEINLNQGTLPFDDTESSHPVPQEDEIQRGLAAAPIASRIRSGLIDAVFLFGCFLIFLLIVFFVPDFGFLTRSSLLGMGGACLLIFTAYVSLFTALGSRTLGMHHESLEVVNFQGQSLTPRETALRCFGYIISLGCFCLGFLWALFDPDRLTWHDRISKTFILESTPAPPATADRTHSSLLP